MSEKFLYQQFCSKCQKTVGLTSYPWNYSPTNYQDDIDRELRIRMEEHQTHLCNDCRYEFATCKAIEITFGDCVGSDNVLWCAKYEGGSLVN